MFDTPALGGFAGRSRRSQAATVLGGTVACLAGYALGTVLLGGGATPLAAGPGDRRLATATASAVCWGYYAVAFVRGRGGPVLNASVYPLVTVGLVQTLRRLRSFDLAVGPLSPSVVLLDPLLSAAAAILPGIGCFTLVLWGWGARLDETQRREWEQSHLTPAFRAAFLRDEE